MSYRVIALLPIIKSQGWTLQVKQAYNLLTLREREQLKGAM